MTNWNVHKYSIPQVNLEPKQTVKSKLEPAIRIEVEPNCLICGQVIREKDQFVAFLKNKVLNPYHAQCWKKLQNDKKF